MKNIQLDPQTKYSSILIKLFKSLIMARVFNNYVHQNGWTVGQSKLYLSWILKTFKQSRKKKVIRLLSECVNVTN